MLHLIEGYRRFHAEQFPQLKDHFRLLADRQTPEVLVITCADSRVVPDLILQAEPGDLFLCRNAGNVIPPGGELAGGVSATIEYAVEVLKVKDVIVCGHSDCGACKAALHPQKGLEKLPLTALWLRFIEAAWKYMGPEIPKDEDERFTRLIHANVLAQLEHLKTHPEVKRGLTAGTLRVHGWYYDILTGTVEAWSERKKQFVPLEETVEEFS
uniref:Carbonic anhydrase n=1 Tax=Acidobacterium capsulatum TaxID=33075 RepID=A0A7V4XSW8_9BACT